MPYQGFLLTEGGTLRQKKQENKFRNTELFESLLRSVLRGRPSGMKVKLWPCVTKNSTELRDFLTFGLAAQVRKPPHSQTGLAACLSDYNSCIVWHFSANTMVFSRKS